MIEVIDVVEKYLVTMVCFYFIAIGIQLLLYFPIKYYPSRVENDKEKNEQIFIYSKLFSYL